MHQRRNGRTWLTIVAATATMALLAAFPAASQSALDGAPSKPRFSKPKERVTKVPECRCQNYGRYLLVGQAACIKTNKGPRMARCILKGNNTMWEFLPEGCPVAENRQSIVTASQLPQ